MRYVSTRGHAPTADFEAVLLGGLAPDGGLYVPETWPRLSNNEIRALAGQPYAEVAWRVITPFIAGALPADELRHMIKKAYAGFHHPAVAPLKQLDANLWLLELFHGPTLAFKDVALQLLVRLMDWALARRGQTATVIGATSGDTGGAAIEAFKHSTRARIFILHPHGRVSDVQRRQMTTTGRDNVHNIALEGSFDDCQALVKSLFADQPLRDEVNLAGVNSINWARVMAQIVYYFTTAVALGAPNRVVDFTVPTGNFGDIYAGYCARRMGLGIGELTVATNINDILHRAFQTGRYDVRPVHATISPSMDIQVSSNFERVLFDACGRDSSSVSAMMDGLKQSGAFTIPDAALGTLRSSFASGRSGEDDVMRTIAATRADTGETLDPHTAVGYCLARAKAVPEHPMVTLATAHPAKFPDAVERACGNRPPVPERIAAIMNAPERYDVLPNDYQQVRTLIRERQ